MAHSKLGASKTGEGKCPICGDPTEFDSRPFCSRRCASVDLNRWLSGGYAIAGRADADEDGDEARAEAGARQVGRDPETDDADG